MLLQVGHMRAELIALEMAAFPNTLSFLHPSHWMLLEREAPLGHGYSAVKGTDSQGNQNVHSA